MRFETAEDYVVFDAQMKLDYYETHGKRMHQKDPPLNWFPTEQVHARAMSLRCVVCVDPGHVGDRLLRPGEFFPNRKCIVCQRRKWRKPRSQYTTAEEWATAHPDTNPKPRESDFPDRAEFEAAMSTHVLRRKEYKKRHNQRTDVADRKNAKARATYAEAKARESKDA